MNLMTTIYFRNNQRRHLVDFLEKYPHISYVTGCLECKFQNFTFK